MDTNQKLNKQEQKVARLERHLALEKVKARKADTRNKIELGGLVIKAKMNGFPKDIILGALIDAFENLQHDKSVKSLFKAKGEAAFMGHKE